MVILSEVPRREQYDVAGNVQRLGDEDSHRYAPTAPGPSDCLHETVVSEGEEIVRTSAKALESP